MSTATEIIGYFKGDHADLVVCDGAPDGRYQPIRGWIVSDGPPDGRGCDYSMRWDTR